MRWRTIVARFCGRRRVCYCATTQQHVGHKAPPVATNAATETYPNNSVKDTIKSPTNFKMPEVTQISRYAAKIINQEGITASKQSRLKQVRAVSKRDIANRAAERAAALKRSHKMKTRSQKSQQQAIV